MRFTRPEHDVIVDFLRHMNHGLLEQSRAYFGGGTAIVLKYGEYRRSLDVDFLCYDNRGFRDIRTAVTAEGPYALVSKDTEIPRDLTTDAYGVRLFLVYKGQRIKFEVVKEGNIPLTGAVDKEFLVPTLDPVSMFATKMLANADRWGDRGVAYRDAIDLGMLIKAIGSIPDEAVALAREAYGDLTLSRGLVGVVNLLAQAEPRELAAETLDMTFDTVSDAVELLRAETRRIFPDHEYFDVEDRWNLD